VEQIRKTDLIRSSLHFLPTNMDSIIHNNAVGSSNVINPIDLAKLTNTPMRRALCKLYFFFNRELTVNNTNDPVVYNQLKNDSIRHLIPYKGHYFDYIVNKEYNTLHEWAEENGEDVGNICYGVNRVFNFAEPVRVYIKLQQLLAFLHPNYTGESVTTDKQNLLTQFDYLLKQMNDLRAKIENI